MTKENRKKIVVVGQTPPPHNGQAKMIEIMLLALRSRFEVSFIRMNYSDSTATAGKFSMMKIVHLFELIVRTWKALGRGKRCYLYYPPASPNLIPVIRDVIFLLAVRPFCKGLVLHFHAGGVSSYAQAHALLRPFMRLAYGRMLAGIVQGNSCPDDPAYFKARNRFVVPHGIDVPTCNNLNRIIPGDPLHILYVGIHIEAKGIFTLLETARTLKDKGVDFIIHTVGRWYTRKEEQRFLQAVESYGLQNCVICLGEKVADGLWQAYAWANVFFFPTRYPWETMGIVQLEAMANSLPVVASDWQGPRDVVVDGETGFLCHPDHACEFADRLQELADDYALRRKMGVAALERYQSFYTADTYMKRLNEVLERLP